MLRWRAENDPDGVPYTFLKGFQGSEFTSGQSLTNHELLVRSKALAARIQEGAKPGDRTLILNQPGLDYIVGVFASMLAGTVAVPAYPPEQTRLNRGLERIRGVADDARPSCVLVDDATAAAVGDALRAALPEARWIDSTAADPELEDAWREPGTGSADLAVLQYTSGSTGHPKGVMLSHGNLMRNLRAGRDAYGIEGRMDGVFWIPPYHDMGLIGGILMTLFCGGRARLFAPFAFLRYPLRWVRAMSEFGSYVSAAPNFAYEMAARAGRDAPEEVARLDLSGWQVAISGAEPVHWKTLEEFSSIFAPAGFRRDAFHPSYGLAENTLVVTGRPCGRSVVRLDAGELERHRVRETAPGPTARTVVGCGTGADPEQRVEIVDPWTGLRCAEDTIGEIWVSGGSVALGYWNRPEETESTFRASIGGVDGPFLRTGDLGFLRDGELFVTGRSKDLVIVRGRNHYPQDLERTAEAAHPGVRSGRCVALSADHEGADELVVAVEGPPAADERVRAEIAEAIRAAIGEQHGIAVHAVAFVPRGGIRRTSSGKLRRSAVRASYLAHEYVSHTPSRAPYTAPRDAIERTVAAIWSSVLAVERVGIHDQFFELGGDSLKAVRLLARLNASEGYTLTLSDVASAHTVEEFADVVRRRGGRSAIAAQDIQIDLG
ncbi:AMP-binding protein [Wenjunlia tyrosinilytica]|uniref:AMP-binding protein n=1 Tax=Wenjunlia tyrosinilytica TaxID=1544741 RepID=UPI001E3E8F1E|nr:AMP-binding protein [Wenjunlia tyrosinilytica]